MKIKKRMLLTGFVVIFGTLLFQPPAPRAGVTAPEPAISSALRIPFIENQGQIAAPGVKYFANIFAGTLFVTEGGELVYTLLNQAGDSAWAIREQLVGGQPARLTGEQPAVTTVNYFAGQDRAQWQSGVPTFAQVSLGEVYQGITALVRAYNDSVEKLFVVAPGGDPAQIQVRVEGADSLRLTRQGALEVATGLGNFGFSTPVAYQDINGTRQYVDVAYQLNQNAYGSAAAMFAWRCS